MEYLVFQLQGAMASWGEAAVGEYRGSHDYPGVSALAGLLAAGLGIKRDEEAELASLRNQLSFAVGVYGTGALLRDYHTAQVPGRATLKGRPHATRRHELGVPKLELNTILSTRDFRQGVHYLVAVACGSGSPGAWSLTDLAQALKQPKFVLYLGRKSCPPTAPLHPRVLEAPGVKEAFDAYQHDLLGEDAPALLRLAWTTEMAVGQEPDLSVVRKDRLIRRAGWQYGDRIEHVKLFGRQGG